MLPRIAFLACPETLPGSPARRADAFEHDLQTKALRSGLADRAELVEIDWRAPLDELAQCQLALLGTAWDYTEQPQEFIARLGALEAAGVQVCNPAAVVSWNADKGYLRALADAGVATIPTLWSDDPDAAAVIAACDALGCDSVVVKRRVGAGAIGQHRFSRGSPPPAGWRMGQPALIQPFLPAIEDEGELSLVFIDGGFSHALRKRPAAGDYRIQSLYGGRETAVAPAAQDIAAAHAVVAALPFAAPPLYARIDMVRDPAGTLCLMEAELIEPYLYPEQGPDLGTRLAGAILRRM